MVNFVFLGFFLCGFLSRTRDTCHYFTKVKDSYICCQVAPSRNDLLCIMEIKVRTERNVCFREFVNDHEHQLGFLSVSYFTHRWWVLLSTAFISQLNWGAAVWAKQPDRHADGIEAVTQSSRCQDRVVPDMSNQISVEGKAALLFSFSSLIDGCQHRQVGKSLNNEV